MAKKSTLGRGLDAVFLENETEPSASVTLLPLSRMEPNPMQPRRDFDEEALAALSDSIRENGIIQPIAVRAVRPGDEQYQIVAGERRWRAARMAGLAEAPVVILELDDEKTALLALVENLQREDLGPVEEARAYVELAQRFSLTQEQIAKRIGKSRSAVANALRLLELPQEILPLVEKGGISAGHARAILSCENEEDKKTLAAMITELSLSVRAAESAAKTLNKKRRAANAEAEKSPEQKRDEQMRRTYLRDVEQRAGKALARQVHIVNDGKKRIELYFSDNDDLEALLESLCGKDFFND